MFFDALKSKLRRISILASAALLASGLVAVDASTAPNIPAASAAAGVVCSSTMTEQNNLRITPSHGQVFYIDSGVTPKVDAAYAAYKIDNSLGSARTNVWVQLSDFVGGTVSLANTADKYQQITVPANGTYSAFFLLKATGATTSKQSHVVSIFDKRPDIQGATRLASCDFSFVKVAETIKASANKINTVTGTTSPATATLGGTYTIVVNGQTGGVGAGSTPDFAAIWASPSAYSSWPTRALRLESTELRICVGSNGNANNPIVLTNQLIYYPGASTPNCLKGSGDYWKGTYTFRIIGTGPSALAPSPVAIISSGSQYKHSDVNGITSNQTVDLSSVASSNISVRVNGSSSVVASTSSSVTIRYQVAISTTSTVPLSVDEVIDQHDSGTSLVTGSVKVGTNLASLSAAADPLVIAADVGKSPPPYHFIGPYTTVSGSTYYIQYDFVIPCGSTTATYGSKVYAYTGDVLIGADSTSISTSNVTTSQSAGCATPTVSNTSTSMNPSAATSPATSVQATTATINGFAYPVSQAGVQYRFAYATDPNLVNGVTYTTYTNVNGSSAVAVSSNLTSLTASTTYYFQLSVKDASGTVYSGSILSFQTLAQPAAVSITTGAATGITGTSATLNGTVNPNLNALSLVYFRYGTSSTLSSGTTDVAVVTDDGTGAQVNLTFSSTSAGNYSVNSDSIANPPVQRVTGLSLGTTYYYRLSATCTAVTTYCPSIGAVIDGNIRTFTAGAPTALTADATNVGETSATLNGTVNANGNTTAVTFCWSTNPAATNGILTSSNCTFATATPSSVTGSTDTSVSANITGLTGGTVYYFQTKAAVTSPAYTTFGSIFSFKTLQILTNSPLGGGTAGTLYSASFTGTGGSSSYTWSTASTLPAGLTLSSTGLLSGTPTAGGSFTIVVRMTDPASGLYVEKTYTLDIVNPVNIAAASVSFTTGVGATVPAFTGTATPAGGISGALTCNAYTSSDTAFSTPLTITNSYAAGTYVLRCTGALAAGYTAGTNSTGTLTINSPSSVTIASSSASYVTGVGATVPTLTATVTPVSGLTGSATCAVYATSDSSYSTPITLTSNTAAGTYVVRCTGTPAANYVITSNTNGVLTINNPVTIAAASASFTTGVGATVPTFSGTATPSAGISGSLTCQVYSTGDSSFTTPLSITSNSSAGSYVIRCTGTVAAGYQITSNTTATLTILSPTPVNVTANSASFVTGVGATVPTLTAVVSPSAGATATSCLAYTNSSFTTAISLTSNTPSGTYPIRCTVTLASNYILGTTVDATLTVYSSVVITANSVTYVSGMGNALPTISGAANPSGGISGSLSCSVFASSDTSFSTPLTISNSTPAGTYVIRCTGTEANGFQITANNTGTLTVNAAATITFHGNFVGSAANTTQTDYGLIALQSNPYVRTGYTFLGWATTANGSALYLDQDTFNFSADTDLYAVWSANVYSIAYSANTATGSPSRTSDSYTVGTSSAILLPSSLGMTKTVNSVSYTFGGWSETAGTSGSGGAVVADPYTPTRSLTLYAVWIAPGSNTVTFHTNYPAGSGALAATSTQTANATTNLSANTFSVAGYTFAGWNTSTSGNGTAYADSASYSFAANLDLYAVWTANQFLVTWDTATNGGAASTVATYTYGGSALSIPVPAARTGYDFLGWYSTAVGGTALATYNGSSLSVTTYTPTADVTYFALWAPKQFVVTWDTSTNGGGQDTTATFTYGGSALSIPVPAARTGYNFVGWFTAATGGSALATYSGSTLSVTTYSPTADVQFFARWALQQFAVTWDTATNGGAPSSVATFTYGGSALTIPVPPTRTGYDFAGWFTASSGGSALATYTSGSLSVGSVTPTADVRYYAQWTPQQYIVTWNTLSNGGGSNSTATYIYGGSALSIPVPAARTGYIFTGWFTSSTGGTALATYFGSTLSVGSVTPTQSIEYFAQWTGVQYSVIWNTSANGGGVNSVATFTYGGSPLNIPVPAARTGYDFVGWFTTSNGSTALSTYSNGTLSVGTLSPTGNEQYYAQWTPQQYVITWDTSTNGGSANTTANFTFGGSPLNIPVPGVRAGNVFTGWFTAPIGGTAVATYSNGSLSTTTVSPTGTTTYYAQWAGLQSVITWDTATNGGDPNTTDNFTYGGSPLNIPVPAARTGYVFTGWFTQATGGLPLATYSNGALSQSTYLPSQTATLFAQWQIVQYVITWNTTANGGSVDANTTWTWGGPALNVPVPAARSGFDFMGWFTAPSGGSAIATYSNNALSTATYAPSASGIVYARWTPTANSNQPPAPPVVLPPIVPVPTTLPPVSGAKETTEGGQQSQSSTSVHGNGSTLALQGPSWSILLNVQTGQGKPNPIDPIQRVILEPGSTAVTSGSGFRANAPVNVYLLTTPVILLGVLTTDNQGMFSGQLPVPTGIQTGEHLLQISGYAPSGLIRTASLRAVFQAMKSETLTARVFFSPDSAKLSPATIAAITALVKKMRNPYVAANVRSIGLVFPVDTAKANKRISSARAQNVADLMRRLGVSANFVIRGDGRSPVASPSSRRVDVTVVYQYKDTGNS